MVWQSDVANRLVLPQGWTAIGRGEDGGAYRRSDGLLVISSACFEKDGKRWQHVSTSRDHRLPSWEDLRAVKELFIGKDRLAIQVLPPEEEYVNLHPYVLHMYACLDGRPVPDFRKAGTI